MLSYLTGVVPAQDEKKSCELSISCAYSIENVRHKHSDYKFALANNSCLNKFLTTRFYQIYILIDAPYPIFFRIKNPASFNLLQLIPLILPRFSFQVS